MEQSTHISEEQLELYALSRLPETEVPRLEEHLLMCESCRTLVDEYEAFALGMRAELSKPLPEPLWNTWFEWLRRPQFALAAGFAAVLLAVVVVSSTRNSGLAPVAAIQLTAMRGEMMVVSPAREYDLTLENVPAEGGPFQVKLVDSTGKQLWAGSVDASPTGQALVKVQKNLSTGAYFVRLDNQTGQTLHEYGLKVSK